MKLSRVSTYLASALCFLAGPANVLASTTNTQKDATQNNTNAKKQYNKRNMQRLLTLLHTVIGCYDDLSGNCRKPQEKLDKIKKSIEEMNTITLDEKCSLSKNEIVKLRDLMKDSSKTIADKAEKLTKDKIAATENKTTTAPNTAKKK